MTCMELVANTNQGVGYHQKCIFKIAASNVNRLCVNYSHDKNCMDIPFYYKNSNGHDIATRNVAFTIRNKVRKYWE